MTAAERRRLILAPFPTVHYYPSPYPWAGALVGEKTPDPQRILKRIGDWEADWLYQPREQEQ